jgi:hypothetical protein
MVNEFLLVLQLFVTKHRRYRIVIVFIAVSRVYMSSFEWNINLYSCCAQYIPSLLQKIGDCQIAFGSGSGARAKEKTKSDYVNSHSRCQGSLTNSLPHGKRRTEYCYPEESPSRSFPSSLSTSPDPSSSDCTDVASAASSLSTTVNGFMSGASEVCLGLQLWLLCLHYV